jgi:hypothetical protein
MIPWDTAANPSTEGLVRPVEASGFRLARTLSTTECSGLEERACTCGPPEILFIRPDGETQTASFVCLGGAGGVVVRMSEPFTDGEGPDLRVYELGTFHGGVDDRFSVYVGTNGSDWILVADAVTNDPGFPYVSIEIPASERGYLYVRVLAAGDGGYTPAGPAILAIEGLHPAFKLSF